MQSQPKKLLEKFITSGPSDSQTKWADRLMLVMAVMGSLIIFLYSWTQRSDPSFDERGFVAALGFLGALGLVLFLLYFLVLTVKLILSGFRALIQSIVIKPIKSLWEFTTASITSSWLAKQVKRVIKRWLTRWESIGFKTSIKPFLSYLEPEIDPPIADVTELTLIHLDEKHNNQEFIKNVIARYQRLGMILALPLMGGWLVLTFLPGIILPAISRVSPHISSLYAFFLIFIWIPACLVGFRALVGVPLRRQSTWRQSLGELMKQEYVDRLADSLNLEAQSTLQERMESLRAIYQRELIRYQQLQQDARETELSINWINRLSQEDQNSALSLFETLNRRILEEIAQREKAQQSQKTRRDILVNLAASGIFSILTGILGFLVGLIQG